jgi:hypothetical protein
VNRLSNCYAVARTLALTVCFAPFASGQTAPPVQPTPGLAQPTSERASIAAEADAISFAISGYSGIVNLSLRNGFQVAFGTGRYDLPGFLVEGDPNYDLAQWKATSTSVQVFRMGYRFNGPMRSGPALAAIVLNQNMRLRSVPLNGESRFRQVGVGISGGYYVHVGRHFYVYPTGAFVRNSVYSGEASVSGTNYEVAKYEPNASVHVGWEWGIGPN